MNKYYKPDYHKQYYEANKQKRIAYAKARWARLTNEEKQEYYENRKIQRVLNKVKNGKVDNEQGCFKKREKKNS